MKFYDQKVVKKVRSLKKEGATTTEIVEKLGITKDTILRWCADIPSNNSNHLKHLEVKNGFKNKGLENINGVVLDKNFAKVFASLIYWCEGAKYTNCNCINFANSDVNLIKTFLKLFRMGFSPREDKLKARLQLHTTHDKKDITSFWSKMLNIPENHFQKPTITKPLAKRKRKDYMGTCTIKYYDFTLFNEIVGTYEAFFKKISG